MSKEMSVIVLGIWVVVVPYLGVPSSWRTVLLVLSGLTIAVIGFLLRNESLAHTGTSAQPRHRTEDSFVESAPAAPPLPEQEPQSPRIGSLN